MTKEFEKVGASNNDNATRKNKKEADKIIKLKIGGGSKFRNLIRTQKLAKL